MTTSLEPYRSLEYSRKVLDKFFLLPLQASFCVGLTFISFVLDSEQLGQLFRDSCFKTKRDIEEWRSQVSFLSDQLG